MRILLSGLLGALVGCATLSSSSPVREAPSAAFFKAYSNVSGRTAMIEVADNCRLLIYTYPKKDENIRLDTDKVMGRWNGPCTEGRPNGKGTLLLAHSFLEESSDEERSHAYKYVGEIRNGFGPIEGMIYEEGYIGGGSVMTDKYMDNVITRKCSSEYRKSNGEYYFTITSPTLCISSEIKSVALKALGTDGLDWFNFVFPDVVQGDHRAARANNPIAASINFLAQPEVQALADTVKSRTDQKVAERQLADAQARKKAYEDQCGDIRKNSYWTKECVAGRDKKTADLYMAEVSAKNQVEAVKAKSENYMYGRKMESEIIASKKNGGDAGLGIKCMARYQDQFAKANREDKFDHDEWAKRRKADRQTNYVVVCPTLKVQKFTCHSTFARGQLSSVDQIPARCVAGSLAKADEKIQHLETIVFSTGKYDASSDMYCIEGSAPVAPALEFTENKDGGIPFFKFSARCIWGTGVSRTNF